MKTSNTNTNTENESDNSAPAADARDSDPAAAPAPEAKTQDYDRQRNSEAAKYRTRLREAEAERDALRARLDTASSQLLATELEHRGIGLKVDGLQQLGYSPADYINEDMTINRDKLQGTLTEVREKLGFDYERRIDPIPGSGTGDPRAGGNLSWADALDRRDNRS